MCYVIDRFEGKFAVCENIDNGEYKNIDLTLIQKGIKEGDIIYNSNGNFILDEKRTADRKNKIKNKFDSLWD